jgi:hypothetical protein
MSETKPCEHDGWTFEIIEDGMAVCQVCGNKRVPNKTDIFWSSVFTFAVLNESKFEIDPEAE